jgi:hypothetical protein
MTVLQLIIGFLFAKYVLKLSLLNNLGSITGGRTSTPALGTLIKVAGTEDVVAAYAATYPDLCQLTEDDENGGLRFEIDKHRVSIRLTAPYSEGRKNAASQQANHTGIHVKK